MLCAASLADMHALLTVVHELDPQFFDIGTTWDGKFYQCFSEGSTPIDHQTTW